MIDESLRLFPPVAIDMRYSTASAQALPPNSSRDEHGNGTSGPRYYIPPNTQILYNVLLIQRRKDLWGEDADIFRPERWLQGSTEDGDNAATQVGDGAKRVAKNPAMFAPFHMGPRLVRLLPHFEGKIPLSF